MDFALDMPADSDLVSMPAGALSFNGQQFSDFNFTALAGFGPGAFTLIDAGSINGSLGANTSGMIDGLPATLAISGNDLVLTVVPEPALRFRFLFSACSCQLLGLFAFYEKSLLRALCRGRHHRRLGCSSQITNVTENAFFR